MSSLCYTYDHDMIFTGFSYLNNMSISGTSLINGFTSGSNSNITANLTVTGSTNLNVLSVSGTSLLNGCLNIGATTTPSSINTKLYVNGDVEILGEITATGDVYFQNSISFTHQLPVVPYTITNPPVVGSARNILASSMDLTRGGTNSTFNGQVIYFTWVALFKNTTYTGLMYCPNAVGSGAGNIEFGIYSSSGALLKKTNTHSILTDVAATRLMDCPFLSTYTPTVSGRYMVAFVINTTASLTIRNSGLNSITSIQAYYDTTSINQISGQISGGNTSLPDPLPSSGITALQATPLILIY